MAKKLNQPIRMCVSCRERDTQDNLLRLQCIDGSIEIFKDIGRSFYLCENCIFEEKKVLKALMRQCKSGDKDKFTNKLKEIIADDRKS
ncbi:protein containing DUF448 [Sulfurimonas gotlandica GD1]|uniref:Protein containing DUF448 n=1 Tax=Sulfurimonas gotlandica (strain DSM 19862 / JCM 16533 / GD1) TaxID=929558 RepID=H1FXT0_SULGG|nr:DUF448 domain-containing protein [Sulfurimonas gotlandica]EHP30700.1 protein containing DUF448 [Sulfurimonas gotlandica GD1]